MSRLTVDQARRIAVAAQGFGAAPAVVTRAQLRRLIGRIQVLQLDSVSVAVRAHYAPVFSRLGPYDRDVLDRAAWSDTARSPRLLVEYWAHEAALMAVEDWPLLRWRMREYVHGRWGVEIVRKNPRLVEAVIAAVTELGPSTAGQIEAHLESGTRRGEGAWWNRSETKWVAEALFASGVLTTAHRAGFARHYELTERALPADVVTCEVDDNVAVRELILKAAGALGVATEADLRDYFRLRPDQSKPAVAELVATGELEPVEVAGWNGQAYLRSGPPVPRADRGTALLCPFDPLIFFRPRTGRLFGFEYRIEIYTPKHKRKYGYYVLPVLCGERLVGRLDLKADRHASTLRLEAAYAEQGVRASSIAAPISARLREMAEWLNLERIAVARRGSLSAPLGSSLGRRK